MGVPGLWELLHPAAETDGLLSLADAAFRSSSARGLRVGVDASLWMFHSKKMLDIPDAGENADLRTLFFKTLSLMARGVLPLFVFDGPRRPKWKRGNHIGGGGGSTPLERDFVDMLDLLGAHWRKAAGEAEADLAAFALKGEIDAVLTDDVDTLLFKCPMIIRNASPALTGNSAAQASATASSQSSFEVVIYRSTTIFDQLALIPDDLILIALLSGGDYNPAGVKGCGPIAALALVRAGFTSSLLAGIRLYGDSPTTLQAFLAQWREQAAQELETNEGNFLSRKMVSLAGKMRAATDFPDPLIVKDYTDPAITTRAMARLHWECDVDVPLLVSFTSRKFEWCCEEIVAKMRNTLWKGLTMRELRRTALAIDRNLPRTLSTADLSPATALASALTLATLASPCPARAAGPSMFVAVHDAKKADSTEGVQSYRLELDPGFFLAAITPHLPSPDPFAIPDEVDAPSESDSPPDPSQPKLRKKPKEITGRAALSHWIPASFVKVDETAMTLVQAYRAKLEDKERKKDELEERRRKRASREPTSLQKKSATDAKGKTKAPERPQASARVLDDVDRVLNGGSTESYLESDSDADVATTSRALHARPSTPPRASKALAPGSPDSDSTRAARLTKSSRSSRQHQSPTKPRAPVVRPPADLIELSDSDDAAPMLVRSPPKLKPKPKVVFAEKKASDVVRLAMGRKKPIEVIMLTDSD